MAGGNTAKPDMLKHELQLTGHAKHELQPVAISIWIFAGTVENCWRVDVKVKICGITNVEDALAAAEAGADVIGLMFYDKSPRVVSIEQAQAIHQQLPPYILRVGVFVDPEPGLVGTAMAHCGLSVLQFHGDEPNDFCRQFGLMSMKAFRIKDESSLLQLSNYTTDALLLDSYVAGKQGGTGEKFNWDLAIDAKKFGKPIFLSGGLTAENVASAVQKVVPFAVDVSSGVESAPGKKDHQKIRDFIAAVRAA
jgi:phosphoribosylanthranilate isomerase